ncbi:hypothetical protein DRO29_01070 [Candidatus Bathyarchaeota archaeon]|nr:MAG: hypothetical protein B6U84_06370 [Candidatus Bathyarchaeota archaeon ex4484_40]RLG98371.1 MAG: hypothetical protein DRO29_01070 [Candidatus Bathyarchaeota archaeon]
MVGKAWAQVEHYSPKTGMVHAARRRRDGAVKFGATAPTLSVSLSWRIRVTASSLRDVTPKENRETKKN